MSFRIFWVAKNAIHVTFTEVIVDMYGEAFFFSKIKTLHMLSIGSKPKSKKSTLRGNKPNPLNKKKFWAQV